MIFEYLRLIGGGVFGVAAMWINFNIIFRDFHSTVNFLIGVAVGLFTIVFLFFQIKKIILDIRIKKRQLEK